LQQRLDSLVEAIAPRSSASARAEIEEFVEVDECGSALETLVDVLAERGEPVPASEMSEIGQLAATIGYPAGLVGRIEPLAEQYLVKP